MKKAIILIERDIYKNKFASETPKTEELEEELRDQVHDYQNPVFERNIINHQQEIRIGKCWSNKFALDDMTYNMYGNQQPMYQVSPQSQDLGEITDEDQNEDNPLLFVDVNLGPDKAERIVVFEGDTADDLANRFAQRHNLNEIMKGKRLDI